MTVKRTPLTEVKPGDKIGEWNGNVWYEVIEPAVFEDSRYVIHVRYPDGSEGERKFTGDFDLPVFT